jgi:hypothetical protein
LVITAYRCHPFAVLSGGTISGVIGELLGHQIGILTPHFFGGNGIVGAQVPIGAGIAFAQKYPVYSWLDMFSYCEIASFAARRSMLSLFESDGIAGAITIAVINYALLGFQFPVDAFYFHRPVRLVPTRKPVNQYRTSLVPECARATSIWMAKMLRSLIS